MDHNNMAGLWQRVEMQFPEIADHVILTRDEYLALLDNGDKVNSETGNSPDYDEGYGDAKDEMEEEIENAHYSGFEEGFEVAKQEMMSFIENLSSMDF